MNLGLKDKARFFRENSLLRKSKIIREAILKGDYKIESINNDVKLQESLIKKEYDLNNLFEISKEIYILDPKALVNILLLTLMGYTRAKSSCFFINKRDGLSVFLNKDFKEEDLSFAIKTISENKIIKNKDFYIFELKTSNTIGYIVLKDLGIENVDHDIQVILPILSLGSNAIENAFLHDNLKKKFKQLEAIHSIGEVLKSSPKLEEVIFLTFSTLEYGLGIKKMLLVSKQDNFYKVFDGYGFREYSHQKLFFDENSELFKLVSKEKYVDIIKNTSIVNQYFSPYDVEEMNVCVFIPLKIYEKVLGFFVIGSIDSLDDYEWRLSLYQVLGSYFATSLYILSIAPFEDKYSKIIDIKTSLRNIFSEQILMAKNFNYKIFFAFVRQVNNNSDISNFLPQFVNVLGNYKIVTYIFQSDSDLSRFIEVLKKDFDIISSSLNSTFEKSVDDILYELELVNK